MEITLNLPENIYRNFSEIARKKHRRIEEVIADKLQVDESAETEDYAKTVAGWTNEDVLALANLKLPNGQAERMSELSEKVQCGTISKVEENEQEIYLEIYNNANLRKAHGIVEAVKRGLINSPDDLK